jgi:hypothetical protein
MGKKNKKIKFDESVTFDEEINAFSKNGFSENDSHSSDSDNLVSHTAQSNYSL